MGWKNLKGRVQRRSHRRSECAVVSLCLTVLSTLAAGSDCRAPAVPMIPDGASASREEMLRAQGAVKVFQSENTRYMKCLEDAFEAAEVVLANSEDTAARGSAKDTHTAAMEAYYGAVSAEEAVASAFQIELREYRSANP